TRRLVPAPATGARIRASVPGRSSISRRQRVIFLTEIAMGALLLAVVRPVSRQRQGPASHYNGGHGSRIVCGPEARGPRGVAGPRPSAPRGGRGGPHGQDAA